MAQRQSSHSFSFSFLSVSLLSAAVFLSSDVAAKAVSTSVFPNSACAGASTSEGGLVGIGRVTLSSGEVETHCGCPSDNLPAFTACPSSSSGESVCNSVLNLESGEFTASCGVIACQGSACPTTVVNTVVVDDEDCFASGKGPLGFSTVDGQSRCACATDDEEDFTICPTIDNGRASCLSVDSDFLGMAYATKETVRCGVACEEGYTLTAENTCTKLHKRAYSSAGPSHSHHHHHTTSGVPSTPTTKKHHHSKTHHHHTTVPTTTTKAHHHHHSKTPTTTPVAPTTSSHSKKHHHHHSSSSTTPSGSSTTPSYSHSATPSAKLRVRAADEFVFSNDVCASDERTCSTGVYGDFTCVRLDDVNECGGCHANGDAIDCMQIEGIASASCLRGGCVVRSCQPGYEQTAEGTCTLKA